MAASVLRSLNFLLLTALGCATALPGCSPEGATLAPDSPPPDGPTMGGAAGSGAPAGGAGNAAGVAATGGFVATSPTGTGGTSSGGGAGGIGFGGDPNLGGTGGDPQGGGGNDSGGQGGTSPVPDFTLQIDTPAPGSTLSDTVVVSGWAPGFMNVEVWDATHQSPPLGQATPGANGYFSLSVDTSSLSEGSTTWTIWAWDSLPGAPPSQSASQDLALIIGTGGSGGSGGAGGSGGTVGDQTIGTGDVDAPAVGPAPVEAGNIGGAPFTLVKNWDFGTDGTIPNIGTLSSEFMYHDHWGTIANGTNYGAVTVAPNQATAISGQPVEDPARPYREFTADAMRAFVRPLSTSQQSVSATAHDAGNGSITAKWSLPSGGQLLGKDLLWEARLRMPETEPAFWLAMWTAGTQWSGGAEMDVLESFGTPNVSPLGTAFHVNSVGGTDTINYWGGWPAGLSAAGVPQASRDLADWHTFSWLYRTDDSYVVYFDGYIVQTGTIHWTLGGTNGGQNVDMWFLFDFGWGHTQVAEVNVTLPASGFGITYEVDYSRVYLR